jgi:CRP/FNR family cyclic AMP-dependent transcriptional regulator
VLYPGVGELLRITQQELGYLVGLSRQRVNEALIALQAAGLIRIEYGGVRVLDLARACRATSPSDTAVSKEKLPLKALPARGPESVSPEKL